MKKTAIFFLLVFFFILASFILRLPISQAAGDLFAYWKFDELVAGSSVQDASGNGFDGTPGGAGGSQNRPQPNSVQKPPISFTNAGSISFDGFDDYIDVPDWSLDMSSGFSVSVWARPTASKSWGRFIDFGNGPASDNIVFGRFENSNTLFFEIYDGASTTKVEAVNAIINNEWHHYVATIDTNGNTVLYRDGVQMQSGTTNPPTSLLTRTVNYIGRSNWVGDEYYEGQMDDLRIYSRALTAQEVVDLSEGEPGPDAPTPTPSPTPVVQSTTTNSTSTVTSVACEMVNSLPAVDLFEIKTWDTFAELYMTPSANATKYFISYYALHNTDEHHAVIFPYENATGVISYIVKDLLPNEKYFFKVRPLSDCKMGDWSNTMEIATSKNNQSAKVFYRNIRDGLFLPLIKPGIVGQKKNELTMNVEGSRKVTCHNTYTVKTGDTLWDISLQLLGSGARYKEIADQNGLNSPFLNSGVNLKINC